MSRFPGWQVRLKEPGSVTVLDVASAGGEPAITIAKVKKQTKRNKAAWS